MQLTNISISISKKGKKRRGFNENDVFKSVTDYPCTFHGQKHFWAVQEIRLIRSTDFFRPCKNHIAELNLFCRLYNACI